VRLPRVAGEVDAHALGQVLQGREGSGAPAILGRP